MASDFAHVAIYGMTKSGKSWLMKRLAARFLKYRQPVICYSGVADLDWPKGVKLTFDHDEFERWLADPENYGAHVLVDEATILFYHARSAVKYPNIFTLASAGRHKGHTAYFATQKPTRLDPMIRENCGELYCFRLRGAKSAHLVYEDFGEAHYNGVPIDKIILQQKKLEFVHIDTNTDEISLGVL